jgi:serine/threonine-protein kinase
MADVYSATDTVLGRTVAAKVLAERHSRDPDLHERFTREARAAALLSVHPNVVTIFDVGEHAGRPFMVMEYMRGGSVRDRVRAGPLHPAVVLRWLAEAARGLDAAHAHGVVHRDVKPGNLLLDESGHVHVSDFGIASASGFETITAPGTVLGTAGYLSPEQARGEPATAASDRYALGVVAFELLTGRRPFASETPVTEAFGHLNADIPSPRLLVPGLPRQVDDVFERALAKEPERRPATAGELVEDLRRAFSGTQVEALGAPPVAGTPTVVRAPRHRHRRAVRLPAALLAGVALLLAGVMVAALVATGEDAPRERTVTRVRTVVQTVSDTASTTTITETATAPDRSQPEEPSEAPSGASGASLNDAGYARMRAEDYEGALPLLEQAVARLSGTGSLAEAYASYNLAFTRFALDSCDGVLALLDRSEDVQGYRNEIADLRRPPARTCEGSSGDDD